MSSHENLFPWRSVERGQGFFIPCLNMQEVAAAGLREALRHRVFDAQARPGIRGGLMGVWFFRKASKRE